MGDFCCYYNGIDFCYAVMVTCYVMVTCVYFFGIIIKSINVNIIIITFSCHNMQTKNIVEKQ